MDKGLLDIGILLEPIEIDRYDYFRLPVTENWCTLIHPDSNLAKKDFIEPSDLLNENIILPPISGISPFSIKSK